MLPLLWTTDLSDYDSDGDLDHLYLNPATGEIKVLLNGNLLDCTSLTATATAIPAYCGLANGAVTLNVAGGIAPFSYLWNNGQTTGSVTGLTAGTYMATVTDGAGCTKIAAATVTSLATFPIQKAITNVSCPGGANGAVALSASGGTAPYTYLWNNSLTTATATGLTAGVYSVTATDANGCTATTTAAVTQPVTTPAPANECPNVCIHCDLDGYMGSTAGYSGQTPPGFCGTVENEQWLGFVATASSVTITATPSNCTIGNGVQLALYPNCTSNSIACNIGLNGGGNTPVSITASVVPGTNYYLLVDGYAGDQCNFIIDVTPAPVEVVRAAVKAFLQGPYVSSTQLMHDSLRAKNLIPLTEPYTGLTNFTHTGGGGGEQTTLAVLSVTGPNAVVDWVFLELRHADMPSQVLATRSALLQRDGDVVDVDGVSPVGFGIAAGPSYFLAMRHRNHLGVQLGAAKPYPDCVALATDFRELPLEGFYAYNGLNVAEKLITGKYTLWAANGRIDPQLKYNGSNNDRTSILSVVGLFTPNAVVPGYYLADYNLDGVVKYNGSANDRNVLLGNVGILTPSAVVEEQVAR
ncbi:MAG: SprB repeat-containing protein [Lewinellaceae bacterium]|nr:SprB repeat-containing protein [Lewinellaceae bacterium]